MDKLDYESVKDLLHTKYIGRNIVYLEKTTSTNDIAKKLGDEGAVEGTVVIAEEQSAGRGRMGRKWATHRGDAIAMTLLLRPEIPVKDAPSITPILALSAVQGIMDSCQIECGIKWPNDVVLDRKKVSGILTEMKAAGSMVGYIVVGIGLNINQEEFEEDIKDIAVSLKKFTGINYDRRKIISAVLNRFEENYDMFKEHGISYFKEELKKYSVLIGKRINISLVEDGFEGEAMDIGDDGSLIVRKDDGKLKRVISGEVTLSGYYVCRN